MCLDFCASNRFCRILYNIAFNPTFVTSGLDIQGLGEGDSDILIEPSCDWVLFDYVSSASDFTRLEDFFFAVCRWSGASRWNGWNACFLVGRSIRVEGFEADIILLSGSVFTGDFSGLVSSALISCLMFGLTSGLMSGMSATGRITPRANSNSTGKI